MANMKHPYNNNSKTMSTSTGRTSTANPENNGQIFTQMFICFYNQTSGTALMEPEQGEPKQSDIDVNNKDRWELDEQNGKITKIHARPLPSLLQEMNIVPSQSSDLAKPERPTFSTTVDTKRRRLMNGQMIVNNHFFMINGQDQQPSP